MHPSCAAGYSFTRVHCKLCQEIRNKGNDNSKDEDESIGNNGNNGNKDSTFFLFEDSRLWMVNGFGVPENAFLR